MAITQVVLGVENSSPSAKKPTDYMFKLKKIETQLNNHKMLEIKAKVFIKLLWQNISVKSNIHLSTCENMLRQNLFNYKHAKLLIEVEYMD